jgi:hypothetical protein
MKLKKTTPRLKIFAVLCSRSKKTGGVSSPILCYEKLLKILDN